MKEKRSSDNEIDSKVIGLLEAETSKIKNFINKTLKFHSDSNKKIEKVNIHECLIEAIEALDRKYFNSYKVVKDFDSK